MDSCGGTGTTQVVRLGAKPQQLVGALDARTRITIRAGQENDAAVYLTFDPSAGWQQGFPLYPGDAYQLDSNGARVAVYGTGPSGGDKTVYILTEGA